jgi:hypothetical protein
MRTRPATSRILFVVAVFALIFGAAEINATAAGQIPTVAKDWHAHEITAVHSHGSDAAVSKARPLRRFAPVDLVLGAIVVLALWLSWPCATRKFRARKSEARFAIRRRGPPAFLAAA